MSYLVVSNAVRITNHGLSLNGKRLMCFDEATIRDKKLEQAYRALDVNYPKFFKMDAQSKLGWLAAEYLLRETLSFQAIVKQDIALVLSNQKASLDTDLNYLNALQAQQEDFLPSPAVFVYTLPNIVAGEICIRHGLKGENNFFIAEQFDAQLLVSYTQALFAEDLCQAALVGWVDVYQESFSGLFVSVESSSDNHIPSFSIEYLNQIFQTPIL